MARNPFGKGLLLFLRDLEKHNTRSWFERNKERYESEVREPARAFIRAMAPHVAKVSPYLVASDKRVGGSLMRIHRDVRFSKSKLPFKTNLGVQFRHIEGRDVHAPGLYFHVDPTAAFLGVGMWRPAADALEAVRRAIADDPQGWKRTRDAKRFREAWTLDGESLKRPPRGFPADHPLIEDLKRKDHTAFRQLPHALLTSPDLIPEVAASYKRSRAYLGFQAAALGIPF